MKTIPLTMLWHEGPMARGYLAVLRNARMRPQRIIRMIAKHHPASGGRLAPFLPGALRRSYAAAVQDMAANHWPRWIARNHPALKQAMAAALQDTLGVPPSVLDLMTGPLNLADHCHELIQIEADTPNDSSVVATLAGLPRDNTVLFTGGGLLRNEILSQPGLRLLHVHPGVLPWVRGADGLLWSVLTRGCPGASAFFMDTGLDTGAVLSTREFHGLRVNVPLPMPSGEVLYRAALSFLDPVLRGLVLTGLFHVTEGAGLAGETPQGAGGETFHFMRPAIRNHALAKIFYGQSPAA